MTALEKCKGTCCMLRERCRRFTEPEANGQKWVPPAWGVQPTGRKRGYVEDVVVFCLNQVPQEEP